MSLFKSNKNKGKFNQNKFPVKSVNDEDNDLEDNEDVNQESTEENESLIIGTNIEDYGLTNEEMEEMGIENQCRDDDDDDSTFNELGIEEDEFEKYQSLSSPSMITGNDNNYQENNDKISFAADQTYQEEYLKDIYDTEEFYFMKFMKERFQKELKEFIRKNRNYQFLKSYDISFLEEGDDIFYLKEKDPYVIQYIFNDEEIFICKKDNSSFKFADKTSIRPFDKVITKFDKEKRIKLYNYLNSVINDKNCNNVEYFSIFCEYFKLPEDKFYQELDDEIKSNLRKELSKRIND